MKPNTNLFQLIKSFIKSQKGISNCLLPNKKEIRIILST